MMKPARASGKVRLSRCGAAFASTIDEFEGRNRETWSERQPSSLPSGEPDLIWRSMKLIAALEAVTVFAPTDDYLDITNLKQWKREIHRLIRPGARIVVDLSRVRSVDSAACGALLSAYRGLAEVGGELKLCGATRSVRALFELVRLHRVFEIFNTRDEAIRSFEL